MICALRTELTRKCAAQIAVVSNRRVLAVCAGRSENTVTDGNNMNSHSTESRSVERKTWCVRRAKIRHAFA
jgi:hypothetical protein